MEMYIAGKWQNADKMIPVRSPFTGETVDEVPDAADAQIQDALAAAERGAKAMRELPAYERYQIMMLAADLASRLRRSRAAGSVEAARIILIATVRPSRWSRAA